VPITVQLQLMPPQHQQLHHQQVAFLSSPPLQLWLPLACMTPLLQTNRQLQLQLPTAAGMPCIDWTHALFTKRGYLLAFTAARAPGGSIAMLQLLPLVVACWGIGQ
jgi:hypothetical protein